MALTFASGAVASAALAADGDSVEGRAVRVTLAMRDWRERITAEVAGLRRETIALFNPTTNSLLGEDFTLPSMSFEAEGEA